MYIRVKLDEMGQNPALATRQAVAELVKLARKNRGLKQRIKKRFPQFFSEQQPEDSRPKSASKSREPRGKSEGSQLKKRIDPMRKEEDRILKKVKKQKAHKKNEEDHDFLDVAQIYPRNLKQSMRRN
jgi:hypothetical protein